MSDLTEWANPDDEIIIDSEEEDSDADRRDQAILLATSRRQSELNARATKPCRVCQLTDPHREVIEQLLGLGVSNRVILKVANQIGQTLHQGEAGWRDLSTQTLNKHRADHLPVRLALSRDIMEHHARQARIDLDDNPRGSILTPGAYAEIVMSASAQNVHASPEQVTPTEGLKAAQTLREIEQAQDTDLQVARMTADLDLIIKAIRNVCTPEQAARISKLVEEGRTE